MDYLIDIITKNYAFYFTTAPEIIIYSNKQYINSVKDISYSKNLSLGGELQNTTLNLILDDSQNILKYLSTSEFDSSYIHVYSTFEGSTQLENTLNVSNISIGFNTFSFEAKDYYNDFNSLCFDIISQTDFPGVIDSFSDAVIPFFLGSWIIDGGAEGYVKCPQVNHPYGKYLYGRMPLTQDKMFPYKLYHNDTLLILNVDYTMNFQSYTYKNGVTGITAFINYNGSADYLTAYPNTNTYEVLDMVDIILSTFTSLPRINKTSAQNLIFDAAMKKRGFSPSARGLNLLFDSRMTASEVISIICNSLGGVDYRFDSLGKIEFIPLDFDILPTSKTHNPSLFFNFDIQSISRDEIQNMITVEFSYSNVSQNAQKRSYNTFDKNFLSIIRFGKKTSRDSQRNRLCLYQYQAAIADKFNSIPNLEYKMTTSFKIKYSDGKNILPGDILRFSHPFDCTNGSIERIYYVSGVNYNTAHKDGVLTINVLDITHYSLFNKNIKLLIHSEGIGITDFYDSSISGNVQIQNTGDITQESVLSFPLNIGWRSISSGRLQITEKRDNYDIFNRHAGLFRTISFYIKMTNLDVDQCLFCVSNTDKDSYYGLEYIAATKNFKFYLVVDGVSIIAPSTPTNCITDYSVHHITLCINNLNYGYFYIDGIWKKTFGTATQKEVLGIFYIGMEKRFSGSYTKRFLGYMGEFMFCLNENILNCNTNTCIVPVNGFSWKGIVN